MNAPDAPRPVDDTRGLAVTQPVAVKPERRAARAIAVAAIAAVAAAAWCVCVLGAVALPFAVFATPASALLWFWIARQLDAIGDAGNRLLAAIAFGFVSPLLGLAIAWMPTACCIAPWPGFVAGCAMLTHMWLQPWAWLPVGVGMGLVAFAVVSVRRAPVRP